jgi:hypothetical protein
MFNLIHLLKQALSLFFKKRTFLLVNVKEVLQRSQISESVHSGA